MKTFNEFVADMNEASKGNAFDMEAARKRVKYKEMADGKYNQHDVKKSDTGLVATRRFDKDDTTTAPKKALDGAVQVKRGRGRPAGKYGSYKKKVAESLKIIEGLDNDADIEDFISDLDEESFIALADFLEESAGTDE